MSEEVAARLKRIRDDNVQSLSMCAGLLAVNEELCVRLAMTQLGAPDQNTAEQGVRFAALLLTAIARRLSGGEIVDIDGMTKQ